MERRGIEHTRRVFEFCLSLAKKEGETMDKRGQGCPSLYKEAFYFALSLFRSYYNLTFRETVSFYQDLFPGKPSFQALHRFLKEKASP